jgi:predicted transcriptional regulator
MKKPIHFSLTRRERQVMDILYRKGSATAGDVMNELSGNPSDSTVRTLLRILEEKGHVRHEEHGLRYVYSPTVSGKAVRQSALRHVIDTFFDGSTATVVASLIGLEGSSLSKDELQRIAKLVEKAQKECGQR